ncbi:HAD family phosphatase [Bradyrhizobium ontarionense]|uniref:HAD family phosphatase n=1 Tax=Bradyrhizobium ontarionense TaxID=2898149 RepID=A0ABY3R9X5_9BRAD|nr:HAD family phosphatase [Bradyrhizobium sp. A19]UFZ03626.1 HAD family phosphatase [Bradyrhizobium sp. A19]
MTRWHVAAVLLDMDGTLLDTEKVYLEASIAALRTLGYTDGVTELCHAMIGIPGPDNERTLLNHFGDDFPLDDVNRLFAVNAAEILHAGMPLKRGVIDLLDAIEAAGLPKAIVTSSSRSTAAEHLRLARIDHRFDAILTRDDVSRAKPHPDLYLLAASRLGTTANACVAIEDSNPGVASAHAAGAITLMVPDIVPPTEQSRAKCAAVLPDLDAAIALLATRSVLPVRA